MGQSTKEKYPKMKITNQLIPAPYFFTFLLFFIGSAAFSQKIPKSRSKPNIIYILADDLGYNEIGVYGQSQIETPNIDALCATGMKFLQHYTGAPVCAPARAIFLTGLHSGKVQIRGNDEWDERGNVWNFRATLADSTLEGQRPMAAGTFTLSTMLKQENYTTAVIGKWGLGAPHTHGVPNKQGFDYFYGFNCQRQAHTLYPVHLWENGRKIILNNDTVPPHARLASGADPLDLTSYAAFQLNDYASDLMFDRLTEFVAKQKDDQNPFFLYWATPVPHVPLQAPQKWVNFYLNKFGSDEEPYLGTNSYFPSRYPKATYAAMISHLDEQVGLLVAQLKETGQYENTLIIFTSDNGPTYAGGVDPDWFESAKPFRGNFGFGKGFLSEGGIRVPFIASWPGVIQASSVSNHVSANYDILPTLADILDISIPENLSGISMFPALLGQKQRKHDHLYWEFAENDGQMAIRLGDFKAIRRNMHKGNLDWELFDLVRDPEEMNNVANQYPQVIKKIQKISKREHTVSPNSNWQYEALGEK
jgi:arylsulfatase A-like enzyme